MTLLERVQFLLGRGDVYLVLSELQDEVSDWKSLASDLVEKVRSLQVALDDANDTIGRFNAELAHRQAYIEKVIRRRTEG